MSPVEPVPDSFDAAACTQRDLAAVLAALGLGEQARSFEAASPGEARRLAQHVARELDATDYGQLPYAFAAFALAVKHDQPGLEDIARHNLRSARRFAGLGDPEPRARLARRRSGARSRLGAGER